MFSEMQDLSRLPSCLGILPDETGSASRSLSLPMRIIRVQARLDGVFYARKECIGPDDTLWLPSSFLRSRAPSFGAESTADVQK